MLHDTVKWNWFCLTYSDVDIVYCNCWVQCRLIFVCDSRNFLLRLLWVKPPYITLFSSKEKHWSCGLQHATLGSFYSDFVSLIDRFIYIFDCLLYKLFINQEKSMWFFCDSFAFEFQGQLRLRIWITILALWWWNLQKKIWMKFLKLYP